MRIHRRRQRIDLCLIGVEDASVHSPYTKADARTIEDIFRFMLNSRSNY